MTEFPPPLPPNQLPGRPAECRKCHYPLDGLPNCGKCPDCGTPYGTPTFENMSVKLQKCPQCDYSLQGISASGRCPECGFLYDDETFVLKGIARGMTTTTPGRKALWIFVAGFGSFAPMALTSTVFIPAAGAMVLGGIGLLWIAAIVYLLMTGKKEKRGTEPFLFAAGGFGSSSEIDPTEGKITLTRWSDVDTVTLDRVSPTWRRLRIGLAGSQPGKFYRVMLDAGVFCDEAQAPTVIETLRRRIDNARA